MASEDKNKGKKEPIVIPFSEENEDWLRSSRKSKQDEKGEAPEKPSSKEAGVKGVADRLK